MRRIAYKTVLQKAEALFLGTRDDLPANVAAPAKVHLNTWAQQLWEAYFWPEWCPIEQRQFRPSWSSATTYGAPTATAAVEKYHVRSGKYFQSLRASNLNQEPESATYVENSAWWAACAASYSGSDWAASTAYTVTDGSATIVRNPADNRYYQCHTAHTSTSTFDSTKFGILTPFQRSIDYDQSGETMIGAVVKIYDRDPRVFFGTAGELDFELGVKIYVTGSANVVWVKLRELPPEWSGENYAAATTYAVDDQVYDDTEGDFFKSLQAANTGHAVTDTTWWERIEFPHVLRDAAAWAAFSSLLTGDGQDDRAAAEILMANNFAALEYQKLSRQQGQSRRLPVKTP